MDRKRIEEIVLEELAALTNSDEEARVEAQARLDEREADDDLMREARSRRGY